MRLYLLRHGQAEADAASDASRRLTPHGCREVDSVARQFLASHQPLQLCLCSPYVRAAQTARRFLDIAAPTVMPVQESILTPDVRASDVMKRLEGLEGPDATHVLLVSHNPLLSELHALLTDGSISQMQILATSELVAIDIDVIGLGMGRQVLRLLPGATPVAD